MLESSPVGWLSVVPPLLTIVLAIISRRVILSLLTGIVVGVVIWQPTPAAFMEIHGGQWSLVYYASESLRSLAQSLFEEHLWASLVDSDHLRVFAFTSILGMQVALIHSSGGMLGVVGWVAPLARTRAGGQLLTWFLGLIIFIDDYANCLLLGSTMRPVTDRLKISREKLAFIVDSTAAPVSGIALVSTWVATEISAMAVGYSSAGVDIGSGAFGLFLLTIPGRFYVIFALVFVFLCALLNRDFGPMLKAERRAAAGDPVGDNDPVLEEGEDHSIVKPQGINAILPIVVTVAVVICLLAYTGMHELAGKPLEAETWQRWAQIVGAGDSYLALVYGSLAGLAVIYGLIGWQRIHTAAEITANMFKGLSHVLPALIILWLAWTLGTLTGDKFLRTGSFLALQIEQLQVGIQFLPTIVFVLSSGVAFATGTSWGTIGIVMPMIIPLVYRLIQLQTGGTPAVDHPILIASIASVLAGAIFGDHCSPISDTTILSSRASSCNYIAHVRTQLPYALVIALVSIFFGTLPAGFGFSNLHLLAAGCVAMLLILLIFGRSAHARVR